MTKSNVILIGMPGCGKSTLGVVLAKILCKEFVDVDLLIQRRIGMTLQSYIDRYGVEAFLMQEEQTVLSLDLENSVISTGGSAVLSAAATEHLKKMGKLVYLRLPYELLESRVGNFDTRGIAKGAGQTLRDIYEYRAPIYEATADVAVDIADNNIYENCALIEENLNK